MGLKPKLAALLVLLVIPVAAAPAGAVSGGSDLPIAQAPYVAWLGGRCTGTLISPTRVLTAGHCLDGRSATEEQLLVGVDGNLLTDKQRAAMAIGVAGYSVAPKFKESFPFAHSSPSNAIAVDDVGLILLTKPLKGVTPVRLAGAGDGALEAPGTQATLMGYGEVATESVAHSLQQGTMPVISAADCGQAFPHAVQSSMGCSEDLAHHSPLIQACPGDSGGPVIVPSASGPVQIGITSWGPEVMNGACGQKFLPDVYMRTAAFRKFIDSKDPVIEPFAPKANRQATSKVAGTARVGKTVTCTSPKLGGDPAKLSYSWSVVKRSGFATLKGQTSRTLEVTNAVYSAAAKESRRLLCTATARNAGGSLTMLSGSVPLKK
jgi:secreted trypsin-like serine protease